MAIHHHHRVGSQRSCRIFRIGKMGKVGGSNAATVSVIRSASDVFQTPPEELPVIDIHSLCSQRTRGTNDAAIAAGLGEILR